MTEQRNIGTSAGECSAETFAEQYSVETLTVQCSAGTLAEQFSAQTVEEQCGARLPEANQSKEMPEERQSERMTSKEKLSDDDKVEQQSNSTAGKVEQSAELHIEEKQGMQRPSKARQSTTATGVAATSTAAMGAIGQLC